MTADRSSRGISLGKPHLPAGPDAAEAPFSIAAAGRIAGSGSGSESAGAQVPIRPPSFLRMTTVAERGRPPGR